MGAYNIIFSHFLRLPPCQQYFFQHPLPLYTTLWGVLPTHPPNQNWNSPYRRAQQDGADEPDHQPVRGRHGHRDQTVPGQTGNF